MSWVQFNLLPDSKLEFNRTQRTKRLVFTIAVVSGAASLAILLIMLGIVHGVQKKLLDDAQKHVKDSSSQLDKLDVNKIITVQNQLKTLPGLHQKKHITSRIFTYLPSITPPTVSINKLDMDLAQNTLSLSGTAGSQKDVNTFIDTLKFAKYKIGSGKQTPAFSNVVESGFSISSTGVDYSVNMSFDPQLFANGLRDDQGKPISPEISVDRSSFNSPLKDPSTTLFNSNQSAAGQK
jgi:hypothetical protein